jgi:hypothetical protein
MFIAPLSASYLGIFLAQPGGGVAGRTSFDE